MDGRRFDALVRALGAAGSRRGAVAAVAGTLLAGAVGRHAGGAPDARSVGDPEPEPAAAGRHRRRRCSPACAAGYDCVKEGRRRVCRCLSGVTCGEACCAAGETCVDGACAAGPEPDCVPAGTPCKDVGLPCCDGHTCASGQGGQRDVACYVPKAGRCARTAECVYGTACVDGRCTLPPAPSPTPTVPSCIPDCDGKDCGDDGCGGACGECDAGDTCCDGTCATCPSGGSCSGSACVCPDGQNNCAGACCSGACCLGAICCTSGTCCGPTCCPPGQSTCCAGTICCADAGTCCAGVVCCVGGTCCGVSCCSGTCCAGFLCCPGGTTCQVTPTIACV